MKNPVRTFREALGLSRSQLGAAIGKSPQTFEKYEAEPPEDLLLKLSDYAASIGRPEASEILFAESIVKNGDAETPEIGTATAPPNGVKNNKASPENGTENYRLDETRDMLTALISSGRKAEVDAILTLVRVMFDQDQDAKGKGRKHSATTLRPTGNANFDKATTAILRDGEKLRHSDEDVSRSRRKPHQRSA